VSFERLMKTAAAQHLGRQRLGQSRCLRRRFSAALIINWSETMPRLDYADPSLSEESPAQFARLPINLTRMLLHAPAETQGFLDLVSGFRRGALDPRLRETVILRVATDEENLYQRMQHLPAAELAGLSGEGVDAITRGDLARLEPRLAVAVRFVDECVTRVKVSDATFVDAKAVFSAQEIVEMTLLTGFYMMIARFLATLAIDLDAAPVDWRQSDCNNECASPVLGQKTTKVHRSRCTPAFPDGGERRQKSPDGSATRRPRSRHRISLEERSNAIQLHCEETNPTDLRPRQQPSLG